MSYPQLQGAVSQLILTKYGDLARNNDGTASFSREYACATSYELTADDILSINSTPVDYSPPSDAYGFVLTGIEKSRANGITTYRANYIGVCSSIFRNVVGASLQSYSASLQGNNFTGTYLAPTLTRYSISSTGNNFGEIPDPGDNVIFVSQFANGFSDDFMPYYTTYLSMTSVRSTKVGQNYIIETVGTRLISIPHPSGS